jgi:cation diffusion facilitator CzcD-associated flavoprotein CzcO
MRVAIVGAGFSGIAMAIALRREALVAEVMLRATGVAGAA